LETNKSLFKQRAWFNEPVHICPTNKRQGIFMLSFESKKKSFRRQNRDLKKICEIKTH